MTLANEYDINELITLRIRQQQEVWKNDYKDNYNLSINTRDYLTNHLNKDLYIFIESRDNKIVATCSLQIIKKLPQCNNNEIYGYICNVFTKEECRNQKLQTKLLQNCIDFTKKHNITELQLIAGKSSIEFYKKFGFKLIYQKDKDDFAMVLNNF